MVRGRHLWEREGEGGEIVAFRHDVDVDIGEERDREERVARKFPRTDAGKIY